MGNKNFSLTIFINIICGRRVIDEMNITLSKRELRSMITRPFSSFLSFWNDTSEAFSGLFVEYSTTFGA